MPPAEPTHQPTRQPAADPSVGPLLRLWPTDRLDAALRRLPGPGRCLPLPSAQDRQAWSAAAGRVDAATLARLHERASASLGQPWPAASARAYSRYFRDGDREEYQNGVFARQDRLSCAAVCSATHPQDERWLDEVADGVQLLCEQSSWCWPAHDDTRRVHGALLPTVTDPYLDLGAGEVAGQLAWLDHVLGDRLDERYPGLRRRVRHETWVRVLEPFRRRRDWHWLGLEGPVHNWNPWIHQNVLAAALQLSPDSARRAELVRLTVVGLDRYVAALPEDGAVDEGFSYWWNGACRALEALDLLARVTGGELAGAEQLAGLRATVAFPHRMHLGGPWYLSLADSRARPGAGLPWHALFRAAAQAGDQDARRHAAAQRRPGEPVAEVREGLGRLLLAITDPAWSTAGAQPAPLVRDVWLPSTQVLLARQRSGTERGLCLAVKGGHNGENHNHNDVGSVVVALHGVPALVDAGRPTYTAQTFGADRYAAWPMRSEWHCVPTIRGSDQAPGSRYRARDVQAARDPDRASVRMDLAAAYPRQDVRHWWRTALLDRREGRVSISEEWELDPDGEAGSDVHLLLHGEVALAAPGEAVVAPPGPGRLRISWEPPPDAAPATLTERPLPDPMLSSVWGPRLTLLRIPLGGSPRGRLVVSVQECE